MISHAELLALGFTAEQIRRRVEAGRLFRVHRGVYAVGHTALTPRARSRAAVLACGPRAVLSHQSAAALLGFRPEWQGAPHVTTPTQHRHKGITVHRSRTLRPQDVTTRHGIPTTTAARTLVDLAEVLPVRQLQAAVNEAEVMRLTTHDELRDLLAGSSGRRGAAQLWPIIVDAPQRTRSELERDFLFLAESLNLPKPDTNTRVENLEVDFAWPRKKLIVEVDGFAYHRTRRAFENDRRRDATLQAAGWRVVRFTYRQMQQRDDVAACLRRIYDAA